MISRAARILCHCIPLRVRWDVGFPLHRQRVFIVVLSPPNIFTNLHAATGCARPVASKIASCSSASDRVCRHVFACDRHLARLARAARAQDCLVGRGSRVRPACVACVVLVARGGRTARDALAAAAGNGILRGLVAGRTGAARGNLARGAAAIAGGGIAGAGRIRAARPPAGIGQAFGARHATGAFNAAASCIARRPASAANGAEDLDIADRHTVNGQAGLGARRPTPTRFPLAGRRRSRARGAARAGRGPRGPGAQAAGRAFGVGQGHRPKRQAALP